MSATQLSAITISSNSVIANDDGFSNSQMYDFRNFPGSISAQKFITFLSDISILPGATGVRAGCMGSFLRRQQALTKAERKTKSLSSVSKSSSKSVADSFCNGKRSASSKKLHEKRGIEQGNSVTASSSPKNYGGTHSFPHSAPASSQYGEIVPQPMISTKEEHQDTPSSRRASSRNFISSPLKRSASVELLQNLDSPKDDAGNGNAFGYDYKLDRSTLYAPVISVAQNDFPVKKSLRRGIPLALSFDPSIPPESTVSFWDTKPFYSSSNCGDEEPSSFSFNSDDFSWRSPPSKSPCFLQYRIAKQFNRNLPLPAIIDKKSFLDEFLDVKVMDTAADKKRFFDRLTPTKGSRYAASSDALKYYPRFVLELLQGPFGRTAYDHAMRFRYINSASAYNYTYSSHRDELILPPPEGTKDVCLWMGCYGIPRDDKRHRGGEDAWFSTGVLNAMGVADGVSEWMDLAGVNPRDFAEDLLKGAVEELFRLKADGILEKASFSPAEFAETALSIAFNNAKHFGSSTAILGVLNARTATLGVANLGDSGGLILRRSNTCGKLSILYRVEEMQHGFNIPYQFIHLPSPDQWEQLKEQGMTRIVKFAQNEWHKSNSSQDHIGDTPKDIRSSNISVSEGDLIILGSDGLFDNLFDYEIASLTALAISPREAKLLCHDIGWATPPQDIARSLALASYWKSLNPQANTPFAKYSKKFSQHRGLIDIFGGKEDDISVAVAWVALREDTLADI